jgi:rSAM/selenodomain-associated transferase 2
LKIAIVIPVLNEASVIEATLRRLPALCGEPEIIVVDGGSTDETVSLARCHAKVVSAPKGRGRQMNAGAAHSNADVLLFLHADTALPDTAITDIVKSMADPRVVGGRFKVRLDDRRWPYRVVGASINLRDRIVRGFTGDQAIFVRAPVFRDMGGYRDIELMEDLDFGRRMCRRGRVVRLPSYVVTSARRWTRKGIARTILLMWALKILYAFGCPPHVLNRLYVDAR